MNIFTSILFTLGISFGISSSTNLIREHDFQQYNSSLSTPVGGFKTATVSSGNWYVQNMSNQIELKKQLILYHTSICAQLSTSDPFNLCQNVNLQVGSKYILSYSVFSNVFTNMVFYVSFNNQNVSSLSVPLANNFSSSTYTFFASTSQVKICFKQTHQPSYDQFGGLIDNVSLILVPKQTISCEYVVDQRLQTITLYGNISYSQEIGQHIQNYYKFFIGAPLYQFNQLKTFATEDGFLGLTLTFDFDFELRTFKGYSTSNQNHTQFQFVLPNFKNNKYFSFELLDKVLKFPSSFLYWTGLVLGKMVTWSRIFFVSYFIAIVVDNQYLALFYVFLQPKTMPQFAKKIYYEAATVIMGGQSELQYTLDILNINSDGFSIENVPQNIPEQVDGEPWFGSFGFSSKFIEGNISNMFSLLLLVFKNMVFRLLYRLFAPIPVKRAMYGQPSMLGKLLLAEFVFMTPTIIPGLLMDMLAPAKNTKEYFYKGFSGLVFFAIIGAFIYYFLITVQYTKVRISSNNDPPSYKFKTQFQEDSMVMIKLLFLPFAVTGNQPLFFSLVAVALVSQLFFLIVLKYNGMSKKKMFLYLSGIVVWTIHHFVFVLFWLGEEDPDLGLLAILSLMMIFFIEIIKFFCRLYSFYEQGQNLYQKVKKEKKMLEKRDKEPKKQKQEKEKTKSNRQIKLESRRKKIEEKEAKNNTFWNWVINKKEEYRQRMIQRSRKLRLKQQQQERRKKQKEEEQQQKRERENPSILTRISNFIKGITRSNKIKNHIEVESIHEEQEQNMKAPRRQLIQLKVEDDQKEQAMGQKNTKKFQSKFILKKKEVQKNEELEVIYQKKKEQDPSVVKKISTFIKGMKPSNKIKDKVEETNQEPEDIIYFQRRKLIELENELRDEMMGLKKKSPEKAQPKEEKPNKQISKTERTKVIVDPHIDLREENNLKRAIYGVPLIIPADMEETQEEKRNQKLWDQSRKKGPKGDFIPKIEYIPEKKKIYRDWTDRKEREKAQQVLPRKSCLKVKEVPKREESPDMSPKGPRRIFVVDPHIDLREENNLKRAIYGVPLIEPQIEEEVVPRRKMILEKKEE